MKLLKAASFVHHDHSATATKLTVGETSENYARVVQIPLIPAQTIESDAKIVVKMSIETDTDIAQGKSDPSYVISDVFYNLF